MARRGRKPDLKRKAKAEALRTAGWTLDEIGKKFGGISRQAVQRMLKPEANREANARRNEKLRQRKHNSIDNSDLA
jgi:hypothetical protein